MRTPLRSFVVAVAGVLAATVALAPALQAQQPPVVTLAPGWVLQAFDATAGTLQDLSLPALRRQFTFEVVLGGQVVEILLEPNDVRSPDFQLLVDDGTKLTQIATPPSITWRGLATAYPNSVVAAAIDGGSMHAVVSLGDGSPMWGIDGLERIDPQQPRTRHFVYASDQTLQLGQCGTDTTGHQHQVPGPAPEARKVAEIAFDCDLEYYQRFGSSTTAVQNNVTAILNGMDAIYRRDVDIEYTVTAVIVRTARTYSSTDMSSLLSEFANYWAQNQGSIRRDLAHLFTGKFSFSGVIGIAYLGVVCTNASYGVEKAYSSSTTTNVGLVCHEVGHNWNAGHCDSSSPCNIMCAGLGGCSRNITSFAPVSISSIVAFKNTRTCLSNPVVRPTLTSLSPTTVPVFPFQQLTLNGSGFTGATSVTVGFVRTNVFQIVNDTQIRLVPPVPLVLGAQSVFVDNAAGSSNGLPLTYTAAAPTHTSPAFATSNIQMPFDLAGDPNDSWILLCAFNDSRTFPFAGAQVLLNNFTLAAGTLSSVGYRNYQFQVPALPLTGLLLYTQAVMVDDVSGQLDAITSVRQTLFF
ncbi:MAG: IPT/TIG domain-containing protein [Planctomycetes bacterium]|nr:IPT/TIG domain-containing protein [Planctomycetota bacterium]